MNKKSSTDLHSTIDERKAKSATSAALKRLSDIHNSGLLTRQDTFLSPIYRALIMETILLTNDVLKRADLLGKRVSFTDQVIPRKAPAINDVTDLVREVRNAICHTNSHLHEVGKFGNVVTAMFIWGKGNTILGDGIIHSSDFDNDMAICFGELKLYLSRHLITAYNQSAIALLDWVRN